MGLSHYVAAYFVYSNMARIFSVRVSLDTATCRMVGLVVRLPLLVELPPNYTFSGKSFKKHGDWGRYTALSAPELGIFRKFFAKTLRLGASYRSYLTHLFHGLPDN